MGKIDLKRKVKVKVKVKLTGVEGEVGDLLQQWSSRLIGMFNLILLLAVFRMAPWPRFCAAASFIIGCRIRRLALINLNKMFKVIGSSF